MTTMALVFATALHAFPGAPEMPEKPENRACRGDLQGDVLRTTIEFEDGSRLIGPWRIARAQQRVHSVTAVLDRVIEVDQRGASQTTPFPHGVAVQFKGGSEQDMIDHAARVWCSTVRQARRTQQMEWTRLPQAQITAAPAITAPDRLAS